VISEINGARLHYDITGEGEPLLWVHGFLGTGGDWKHIFNEPPAGFQLIAPDLRGHGSSTNPANTFSFRDTARDVLALLRQLGLQRVKAIGLSGGGITLLHMAVMEPDAVGAMVVVSAAPYFPDQARALQRQLSEAMLGEVEMDRMRRCHTQGEAQIQQLLTYGRAMADSYDDVSFTPSSLSEITAKTMIVFGDSDPLYPVSLAFELHAGIPRSSLWVVPGGGHGPIFGDHAARFSETALTFLRE
jgi:pimeloyl-ACP methyl ester carboxylesterase